MWLISLVEGERSLFPASVCGWSVLFCWEVGLRQTHLVTNSTRSCSIFKAKQGVKCSSGAWACLSAFLSPLLDPHLQAAEQRAAAGGLLQFHLSINNKQWGFYSDNRPFSAPVTSVERKTPLPKDKVKRKKFLNHFVRFILKNWCWKKNEDLN